MLTLLTNYGVDPLDNLRQIQNDNDNELTLNAFLENKPKQNSDDGIKESANIKEGMNINEITEIVSDKIIDLIKKQLKK